MTPWQYWRGMHIAALAGDNQCAYLLLQLGPLHGPRTPEYGMTGADPSRWSMTPEEWEGQKLS